MTEPQISRRPVSGADNEFLCELYCSARREEVEQFGWAPNQADAFLRMQFTSRQLAYKMQFPLAMHEVIVFGETPVGRLITDRSAASILLTDIAVLPKFQGKGIATSIVRQLQHESAASGLPLVLHVDKVNLHARNFYKKLGFTIKAETQLMYEMKWAADAC